MTSENVGVAGGAVVGWGDEVGEVQRAAEASRLPVRSGGHRTHPNLKDTAADFIREQILSGGFRPGGKVDQDEIAKTLGISRLPVREALIELAQEGFVVAIPRRGAFVIELGVDDIIDHYRVYGMVAGLAARRCAENLDASVLAELRDVHERLARATDPVVQADLNYQFHRIINHASGSRQLLSILWFLGRGLPIGLFRFTPEWAAKAAVHHGLIFSSLEARDPESAAASVERHIREAGAFTVETLRSLGYWTNREPESD